MSLSRDWLRKLWTLLATGSFGSYQNYVWEDCSMTRKTLVIDLGQNKQATHVGRKHSFSVPPQTHAHTPPPGRLLRSSEQTRVPAFLRRSTLNANREPDKKETEHLNRVYSGKPTLTRVFVCVSETPWPVPSPIGSGPCPVKEGRAPPQHNGPCGAFASCSSL